ncbi:chalcone isomerase family protein [Pseudomonas sp. SWRI92]|uniref:Chalcone isomerase family protein n=1 Tax=Pseudomonas marvdashtae TaxID=2745500 RepID=A0A923FKC9_9PSED|nr:MULTISPECIES: chalcone isomerase family protein [Pseudomonas]MBC3372615.1 chalcone isomerase family protein [Pseudomonas sp. SWRI92]MBV4551817.1 chalcone isomerase family protein [Pseudomonas marvdashtae]
MPESLAAHIRLIGALILALVLYASQAVADWRVALPGAHLVGEADFRWFGLDIYQARLWSTEPTPSLDSPFALELNYHRKISRQALVQTSLEEMQRVADTPVDAARLDAWAAEMRRAFVDVKPGTQITGVYLPGQGCRFYVDGRLSHEVTDPLFARQFFAIWLDPRTREPALRKRLLGLAASSERRSAP